ncbi:MAG: addiction module protein [Candidatus Hydrogenedentes bacterium]|nr:addiction module protein [Candidatus Hydrogenedentota bacterium]
MSTDEIINEAQALPPEERAVVVDSLLRSLNPPDPKMDSAWVSVARERASELRSGSVKAVPGDEVFAKLEKRFPTE